MIGISHAWSLIDLLTPPCGSELARNDCFPLANDVDCQSAIASKLAPTTGRLRQVQIGKEECC
jgi:hypothetical protein